MLTRGVVQKLVRKSDHNIPAFVPPVMEQELSVVVGATSEDTTNIVVPMPELKSSGGNKRNRDRWLSTKEVAATMGVSPSTVKRWADQGVLTCHRTEGAHRRFLKSDVLDLSRSKGEDPWRDVVHRGSASEIASFFRFERFKGVSWDEIRVRVKNMMVELESERSDGGIKYAEFAEVYQKCMRALILLGEQLPAPSGKRWYVLSHSTRGSRIGAQLVELALKQEGINVVYLAGESDYSELLQKSECAGVVVVADGRSGVKRFLDEVSQACQNQTLISLADVDAPGITRVDAISDIASVVG